MTRARAYATSLYRPACGVALLVVAACGGLSTAGLLDQPRVDAGRPSQGAPGVGGTNTGDDAGGLHLSTEDAALDASIDTAPPVADAPSEARPAGDGNPFDGEADGEGAADVATPDRPDAPTVCGELTQCCGRLVIAPPLAAACYAPTLQGDASDTSACASTLVGFRDAGLCP